MHRSAIDQLEDHAKRSIRAFLRAPAPAAEAAFWNLVYDRDTEVSLDRARQLDEQLTSCPRKVQDILDGWRP